MNRNDRSRLNAVAAALMAAYGTLASAALPTGGQVAAGSAAIAATANKMTITQGSQHAVLNWQSFNIGVGDAVQFLQPNSASVALNRVIGSDPSSILGSLSANGKVFLVNPHGILFGREAQVNVNGLVASTLDIADADLMANRLRFGGAGTGAVSNLGSIDAGGGYVALLGAAVSNDGVISAKLGSVALAAGSAVTLDVAGDGLLSVALDAGAAGALARNGGVIRADGGQVLLTARAAGALLGSAVNNSGVIEARTIDQRGGSIRLLGDMQAGSVHVGGRLDAGAPDGGDGGFIETSAARVKVAGGAAVSTRAPQGRTGRWLIDPADYTISADLSGDINAADLATALGFTNVDIYSSSGSGGSAGNINVNGSVAWSSNTLTLTAANNINLNAVMSATGNASVALNTATGNGPDAGVAGGKVLAGMDANGFTGRLDFSGSGGLAINGAAYTVISDLAGLQAMQGNMSGNYALGGNIDASGAGFTPVGGVIPYGYATNNRFYGALNGLGHSIDGLTISQVTQNDIGLFGMTDGARISNVGLAGGSTVGGFAVGSLVGYATNGTTITNSYSTQPVQAIGQNVGGLVGATDGAAVAITRSFATGSVTANGPNRAWTGGLVGNNSGTIRDSYASGAVNTTSGADASAGTGGLVGQNRGAIIDSYASGTVNGQYSTGGLVGTLDYAASVTRSYATGAVAGGERTGGLVGQSYYASVTDSYASGAVSGTYGVGGLMGTNDSTTVSGGRYDGSAVTALASPGGLVGDYGGTVTNSQYNIDSVVLRGGPAATVNVGPTLHGLYGAQYADWRANGPLDIANYAATLVPAGGYYVISGSAGLRDMLGFADVPSIKFRLGADIDLAPIAGWNIPRFQGVEFDGAGHTLANLQIDRQAGVLGMIGFLTGGQLHDIHLTGASVTGRDAVGLLVGYNVGAISNSTAQGTVQSDSVHVGGLVGAHVGGGTIVDSSANANVTGVDNVGGLVGLSEAGIASSHATGTVSGNDSVGGLLGLNNGSVAGSDAVAAVTGHDGVGGLIGYNAKTVTTSYSQGTVSGNNNVGGLTGYNGISISASYSGATVSGVARVGGLAGHSVAAVSGSYATGAVTGSTDVGGLLGLNSGGVGGQGGFGFFGNGLPGTPGSNGTVSNSYASGAVTGGSNVGGLVGRNSGGAGGAGGFGMMPGIGGPGGTGGNALIGTSYATGAVSGTASVGGLVGANTAGAAGTPNANPGGGAGGAGGSASVADSYWDTSTSGQAASAAGTGLDTLGMMRKSSFTGFDFTTPVWGFVTAGSSYPVLCAYGACGSGVTTVYIGALDGASIYGSNPLLGYTVVDANGTPVVMNGAAIADPAAAQYSGAPAATSNVGAYSYSYASGLSLTGSDTGSYALAAGPAPGTWNVTPATVTVTAASAARGYGAANPALGAAYAGFVNGETAAVLTAAPVVASAAGPATGVGQYATVASGAQAQNYSFSYVDGVLSVTAAPLTVTADSGARLYGGANPAFGVSYSGFVNGETAAVLAAAPTVATAAATASGVGQYATVASGGAAANYSFSYVDGVLDVNPAPLVATAASGARLYGGANPAFGVSYSGFVNGETAAVLAAAPTVASAAGTASGVGQYATVASGGAAANYSFSYVDGVLDVNPAPLAATAGSAARLYGAANPVFGVSYSGFVNGETASVLAAAPTVASAAGTASGVGQYATVASGGAAANYSFSYVDGVLSVNPAPLVATAGSAARLYGGANPAFGVSYSGFVNGETAAVLALAPTAASAATTASGVGQYATVASGGAAANYSFSYVDGVLSVNPAPLTVTAGSGARLYGGANPAFGVSYSGFVNGETASALAAAPTVASAATTASGVGQYATVASGGAAANYSFSYVDGVLTVNPATLTARAADVERVYGSATPVLSVSYSGFVNGDTVAVLGAPALASSSGIDAGSHAITVAGAQAPNYIVAYVDGVLTIRPAPLSITANDAARLQGDANPALSATYAGFQYGDTAATALASPVVLATAATPASAAGSYAITASGASAANYTISYHEGVLAVAPLPPPVDPAAPPFQDGLAAALTSVFRLPEVVPPGVAPAGVGPLAGLNLTLVGGGMAGAPECADLRTCLVRRP